MSENETDRLSRGATDRAHSGPGNNPCEEKAEFADEAYKGADDQAPVPAPTYNKDEAWVQEYIRQFGREPSFF